MNKKIETLLCSCCGQYTQGRQWWNRDRGYGLCKKCIPFCKKGYTDEKEFEKCYGKDSIHYNLKEK